jgi:predicted DNA-binding transcriptional regulator AlpA
MTGARDRPRDNRLRRLLDVSQVMERLRISRAAAYRLMNRLPGRVYIGKSIRVPEAALDAFLASGGDACPDNAKPTSIFEGKPGGAGSTTTEASKSERAPTNRTKYWLTRLQSEFKTSNSRRPPNTSE